MRKQRKQRKLGPKRVLKTASHLLQTLLHNNPGMHGRESIYDAIETLSHFAGERAKPYEWVCKS